MNIKSNKKLLTTEDALKKLINDYQDTYGHDRKVVVNNDDDIKEIIKLCKNLKEDDIISLALKSLLLFNTYNVDFIKQEISI